MTPEEMIFTFKQGSEESFKEAWSRINESYDKTKPKMTLGLLLTSFYFGLVLRYRYGLDTLVGGDFLQSDGDQAFDAINLNKSSVYFFAIYFSCNLLICNNSPSTRYI